MSRVTALYMVQVSAIDDEDFPFLGKGSTSIAPHGRRRENNFGYFYSRLVGAIVVFPARTLPSLQIGLTR